MERGADRTTKQDARNVLEVALESLGRVRASSHPLGFTHVDLSPLVPNASGAVRLHMWSPDSLAAADPLGGTHDHTWGLTSTVLAGLLENVLLEISEDDLGDHAVVDVAYGDTVDLLIPRGRRVNVRERERQLVRAGGIYRMPPRAFHRTSVVEFPAATLVVATPLAVGDPQIVTPFAIAPHGLQSERHEADEEQVRRELVTLLDHLT
jgi:hypothetical protein